MKILVVDDDFISRKVIAAILAEYGTVDIAVNGIEAGNAVALSYHENQPYDLICLDIQMPEMDGHEVLSHIRNNEEKAGILSSSGVKIIMTTGLKDMKNIMTAYNSLCDSYITKPIQKESLVNALKELNLID